MLSPTPHSSSSNQARIPSVRTAPNHRIDTTHHHNDDDEHLMASPLVPKASNVVPSPPPAKNINNTIISSIPAVSPASNSSSISRPHHHHHHHHQTGGLKDFFFNSHSNSNNTSGGIGGGALTNVTATTRPESRTSTTATTTTTTRAINRRQQNPPLAKIADIDEVADAIDSDFESESDFDNDRQSRGQVKRPTATKSGHNANNKGTASSSSSSPQRNSNNNNNNIYMSSGARRYSHPLHAIMQGTVPAYQIAEEAFERHTSEQERKKRLFSGYTTTSTTATHVKNQQQPLGQNTIRRTLEMNHGENDDDDADDYDNATATSAPASTARTRNTTPASSPSKQTLLLPPPLSHNRHQHGGAGGSQHTAVQLQRQASFIPSHGSFRLTSGGTTSDLARAGSFSSLLPSGVYGGNQQHHQYGGNASSSGAGSPSDPHLLDRHRNSFFGSGTLASSAGSIASGGGPAFSPTSPSLLMTGQSATVTAVRSVTELEAIEQLTRKQHEFALLASLEARHEYVRDFFRKRIGWTSASASLQRAEGIIRAQIEVSCAQFYPRLERMSQPLQVKRMFNIHPDFRHFSPYPEEQTIWVKEQLFAAEEQYRSELLLEFDLLTPRIAVNVAELYHRAEMRSAFSIIFKKWKLENKAFFKRREMMAKTWTSLALQYVQEQHELHERQKFRTFNLPIQLYHFECTELITRQMLVDHEAMVRRDHILKPEEEVAARIAEKRKLFRSLQCRMPMPWNVFCDRWDITHREEMPARSDIEREQLAGNYSLLEEFEHVRRALIQFESEKEFVVACKSLMKSVKEMERRNEVITLSHETEQEEKNDENEDGEIGESTQKKQKKNNAELHQHQMIIAYAGTPIRKTQKRSALIHKSVKVRNNNNNNNNNNNDDALDQDYYELENVEEYRDFYRFVDQCLEDVPESVIVSLTNEKAKDNEEQQQQQSSSSLTSPIVHDENAHQQKEQEAVRTITTLLIRELLEFEHRRREEIEFFYRMHSNAWRWFNHGQQQYQRRGFFALPSTAPYLAIESPARSLSRSHTTSMRSSVISPSSAMASHQPSPRFSNARQHQRQQQQSLGDFNNNVSAVGSDEKSTAIVTECNNSGNSRGVVNNLFPVPIGAAATATETVVGRTTTPSPTIFVQQDSPAKQQRENLKTTSNTEENENDDKNAPSPTPPLASPKRKERKTSFALFDSSSSLPALKNNNNNNNHVTSSSPPTNTDPKYQTAVRRSSISSAQPNNSGGKNNNSLTPFASPGSILQHQHEQHQQYQQHQQYSPNDTSASLPFLSPNDSTTTAFINDNNENNKPLRKTNSESSLTGGMVPSSTEAVEANKRKPFRARRLSQQPMEIPQLSPQAMRAVAAAEQTKEKLSRTGSTVNATNVNSFVQGGGGTGFTSANSRRRVSIQIHGHHQQQPQSISATSNSTPPRDSSHYQQQQYDDVGSAFGPGLISTQHSLNAFSSEATPTDAVLASLAHHHHHHQHHQQQLLNRSNSSSCSAGSGVHAAAAAAALLTAHSSSVPIVDPKVALQLWRQVEYQRKAISYFEQREFSQMMGDLDNFSFCFSNNGEDDEDDEEEEIEEYEEENGLIKHKNHAVRTVEICPMMLPLKQKMDSLIEQYRKCDFYRKAWAIEKQWLEEANKILVIESGLRNDLLGWSARGGYQGPFVLTHHHHQDNTNNNNNASITSFSPMMLSTTNNSNINSSITSLLLASTTSSQAQQNYASSVIRSVMNSSNRSSGGVNISKREVVKKKCETTGQEEEVLEDKGDSVQFSEDFVVTVMSSMGSHEVSASWSSMMMAFC